MRGQWSVGQSGHSGYQDTKDLVTFIIFSMNYLLNYLLT